MIKLSGLSKLFLLTLCMLGLAGCSSLTAPASASFASVTLTGYTAEKICETTTSVFHENGYGGSVVGENRMVFIREGSRLETISRDGLIAAQNGESTIVKVRAELIKLGEEVYRLQCQTFMVIDAGQMLEEEVRLSNIRSRPYQKMLNEVKSRLP
jgi:hypothetical protein